MDFENLIETAYKAFNARKIDEVLAIMQPDVDWPNGWEGGYVHGHNAIREYWTRQWNEVDPSVEPVAFKKLSADTWEVEVHQIVKDLNGQILSDGFVKHVYTLSNGLVKKMEIR